MHPVSAVGNAGTQDCVHAGAAKPGCSLDLGNGRSSVDRAVDRFALRGCGPLRVSERVAVRGGGCTNGLEG